MLHPSPERAGAVGDINNAKTKQRLLCESGLMIFAVL